MSGWSYTVQAGDSLVAIALKFYGDKSYWQKIYEANKNEIGSDPRSLRIGMTLVIPPQDSGSLILNEQAQMESYSPSLSGKEPEVSPLKVQSAIISDDYNGNSQVVVDSKPLKQETERKRNWLKRFKLGTLGKPFAGLITVLGIIGALIPISNYLQERPNLNLLDSSVRLASPSDIRYPYLQELYDLYAQTPLELDEGLRMFTSNEYWEILSTSSSEIEVSSLDAFQRDQEEQEEGLKTLREDVRNAQNYYSNPELQGVENIRIALDRIHQELGSVVNKRNNLAATPRLIVFLTVENRSKLPNLVRGRGLLAVYNDQNMVLTLPLTVELADERNQSDTVLENDNSVEDGDNSSNRLLEQANAVLRSHTLDAKNAVVFQAISPAVGSLSEEEQSNFDVALEEGYKYLLVLRDMHGKTYSTEGDLSRLSLDDDLKPLESKAERLVQRRTTRIFPF